MNILTYLFEKIPNGFIGDIFKKVEKPWDAIQVKDILLSNLQKSSSRKIYNSVVLDGGIYIGKGVTIEPFCVINGPVYIGSNCYIRSNSLIRPGTVIGNNVTIGHAVEVKNSIIMDECKLDSHSFVGDSIFGFSVRNGSATITANRRFDQKDIKIKFKDREYETEFDKFGCVIGDYSRLGANCTTAPGVIIGQHVWVYPNCFIARFIPSNTFVKQKQSLISSAKEKVILKQLDKLNKR